MTHADIESLPRLGSGAYTTVYDEGDGNVLMLSIDDFKADLARGIYGSSRFFPEVEKLDVLDDDYVYRTKKVEVHYGYTSLIKSLNEESLAIYENLICVESEGERLEMDRLHEIENDELRETLTKAIPQMMSNPHLDVGPHNVGVGEDGQIVLFDIFYGG